MHCATVCRFAVTRRGRVRALNRHCTEDLTEELGAGRDELNRRARARASALILPPPPTTWALRKAKQQASPRAYNRAMRTYYYSAVQLLLRKLSELKPARVGLVHSWKPTLPFSLLYAANLTFHTPTQKRLEPFCNKNTQIQCMTISSSKSWGSNLYSGKFSFIFIDIWGGFGGFERGVLTVAMRECVMREREALRRTAFLEGGRLTFAALWWPVCPVKSCHVKTSYSSTLTGASLVSLLSMVEFFCHTTAP